MISVATSYVGAWLLQCKFPGNLTCLIYAKQKQPGSKKSVRPSRSHNGYKRPKTLISSKAKKLNILYSNDIQYSSLQCIFLHKVFVDFYLL